MNFWILFLFLCEKIIPVEKGDKQVWLLKYLSGTDMSVVVHIVQEVSDDVYEEPIV